jgi:hypothetical protein
MSYQKHIHTYTHNQSKAQSDARTQAQDIAAQLQSSITSMLKIVNRVIETNEIDGDVDVLGNASIVHSKLSKVETEFNKKTKEISSEMSKCIAQHFHYLESDFSKMSDAIEKFGLVGDDANVASVYSDFVAASNGCFEDSSSSSSSSIGSTSRSVGGGESDSFDEYMSAPVSSDAAGAAAADGGSGTINQGSDYDEYDVQEMVANNTINAIDRLGKTPLMLSVSSGNLQRTALLLAAGANVNYKGQVNEIYIIYLHGGISLPLSPSVSFSLSLAYLFFFFQVFVRTPFSFKCDDTACLQVSVRLVTSSSDNV